jgi:hypothetical protein
MSTPTITKVEEDLALFMRAAEEAALDGGAPATAFALDQTYVSGSSYQWVYEAIRNIEQLFARMKAAGLDTSKVRADFDHLQIDVMDSDGNIIAVPLKRRISNIGTPMDPETELLHYYSRLNIGGGSRRWGIHNLNASYGMGVRASLLPWTDAIFITSVPGDGSYGITLRGTSDVNGNSSYSKVHPVTYTEDLTAVASPSPLVKLAGDDDDVYYLRSHTGTVIALTEDMVQPDVREHGGFTIVLLGKGDYTAIVDHDETPMKGETSAGIIPAVADRFVGGLFPVRTQTLFNPDPGSAKGTSNEWTVDGVLWRGNNRAAKTLTDWTSRATKLDTIYADGFGTTITPYLLPEKHFHVGSFTEAEKEAEQLVDPQAHFEYRSDDTYGKVTGTGKAPRIDSMLPFQGMGQVIVAYNSEVYAVKDSPGAERAKVLGPWGISQNRVARNVLLVITPPTQKSIHDKTFGITQNNARSNITGPNGENLPYTTWQQAFIERFPKEISDMLSVRPPTSAKLISEDDINKMENRLLGEPDKKSKTKAVRVVDENGTEDGEALDSEVETSAGNGKGKGRSGTASKTSTRAIQKVGGLIKTTNRRPKRPKPPQPEFLSPKQWSDNNYDPNLFVVVRVEGAGYAIEMNQNHRIMQRQQRYFWDDTLTGYFSDGKRNRIRAKILATRGGVRSSVAFAEAQKAVLTEIEYVYRHDALATFIGAQADCINADGSVNYTMFNNLIVNNDDGATMTMTVALGGIYPQEEAIKSRINSLAGRSSV